MVTNDLSAIRRVEERQLALAVEITEEVHQASGVAQRELGLVAGV